jgi:hypothetical protein
MVVTGVVLPTLAAITTTTTVITPPRKAAGGTALRAIDSALVLPVRTKVAPKPAPDATPTK